MNSMKKIIKYMEFYIDKYRIELGAINGIILGIGLIEFVSNSKNGLVIFVLGLIYFFISQRILIQIKNL